MKRSDTVAVSVVIPARDREHTLHRALTSVVAQRPLPAEIIVIDDASSDDTARVASELGATVLRNNTRLGAGASRNRGLHASTQPWVAFLDSDDEWLPGHLARMQPYFENYQLVSESALVPPAVDDGARLLGNPSSINAALMLPFDVLEPGCRIVTSGTAVNAAVALEAGGFATTDLAEDLDLWIRMIERAPGIALGTTGAIYYRHEGQASSDRRLMRASALERVDSYRDRNWYWINVRNQYFAQQQWDEFRQCVRSGDTRKTMAVLTWLICHPRSVQAIVQLTRARRCAERRAKREWKQHEKLIDLTVSMHAASSPAL